MGCTKWNSDDGNDDQTNARESFLADASLGLSFILHGLGIFEPRLSWSGLLDVWGVVYDFKQVLDGIWM
jgi:hypothetical protein